MELDIPSDLQPPSTTRNLPPRSRATSLARSAGSRTGSRSSSRSSNALKGDVITGTRRDTDREALGVDVLQQEMQTIPDPEAYTMRDGNGSHLPYGNQSHQQTRRMGYPTHSEYDLSYDFMLEEESRGPGDSFEAFPAEDNGSASRRKRKRRDTADSNYSLSAADSSSNWQMTEDVPPLRLGFEQGSASGSGSGSGSAAMGSQSSRFEDIPAEQSWKTESDEVAGLLLREEEDQNSQYNTSSGPSSQELPKKDRKGKGKARAQTPESDSVIVISDSPPAKEPEVAARPIGTPVADPLSSYTCPICFSPPVNATLTPCGHICCGACLFAALKMTMQRAISSYPGVPEARCPVCRATIPGWDGKGGGVIGLKARAIFRL